VSRYSWMLDSDPKGTIEPLKPLRGLPAGPAMTAAELKAWRALWADRLARGVPVPPFPRSELHYSGSPCEGDCPNGVHGREA
jgi:hypothetical protein